MRTKIKYYADISISLKGNHDDIEKVMKKIIDFSFLQEDEDITIESDSYDLCITVQSGNLSKIKSVVASIERYVIKFKGADIL